MHLLGVPGRVAPSSSGRASSRRCTAGSTAARIEETKTRSGSPGGRSRVTRVTWVVVAIAVLLLLLAVFVVVLYNRLVRLRNRTENAWAQVDVQLRRRYDLIPNLVETVKGYASHERATFEEVTKARTAAQQARTVPEQAEAENFDGGHRAAVRRRRGLPGAARDGELPAAAGAARGHGAEDRRLAPGLQRRGAELRHGARDRPDEHRGRPVQLRREAVFRDRGTGRPGGAEGPVLRAYRLLAVALLFLLASPATADAKSFVLPDANVEIRRARRFAAGRGDDHVPLRGSFSGAFREIPLREGERISNIFVAEGASGTRLAGRLRSGASAYPAATESGTSRAALGSSGTSARRTSCGPSRSATG